MLNIGTNRECFFDDYLVDTSKTTAEFLVHQPTERDIVFTFDKDWEGDGCDFQHFFYDDEYKGGMYRMYYLGWKTLNGEQIQEHLDIVVCTAESKDGIHWERPSLGISEWKGSKDNNIIVGLELGIDIDNFMVFRDDNPACPKEERYKGIMQYRDAETPNCLYCFTSPDGLHFTKNRKITDKGYFDSLNIFFWDKDAQLYRGYYRWMHTVEGVNEGRPIRDIRYIESKDFVNWTEPKMIDFGDAEDYALYTSVIQLYYRSKGRFIGFPTRYCEYPEWNGSFEELCGKEKRRMRMTVQERFGLTLTDCVFMTSRDGLHYTRYDDAFIRPGAEYDANWVYGDAYPTVGLLETPPYFTGSDNELTMFTFRNHWLGIPTELIRNTIRMDGFVSLHAKYKGARVVTKPFVYEGENMYVNFSTSARGYMVFTLVCGDEREKSCVTFGDRTDRKVAFENPEAVKKFAGREVVLEVEMKDSDLYAVRFGE